MGVLRTKEPQGKINLKMEPHVHLQNPKPRYFFPAWEAEVVLIYCSVIS